MVVSCQVFRQKFCMLLTHLSYVFYCTDFQRGIAIRVPEVGRMSAEPFGATCPPRNSEILILFYLFSLRSPVASPVITEHRVSASRLPKPANGYGLKPVLFSSFPEMYSPHGRFSITF
jgi:hypothetical protein